MKRIVLFIMPLIAMLLGMNACKGNDPVQPAEKKARYTIMVYGNAGGSMDSYIEHLWERTKPLMKSKDVRLGFFYKYGKKVDDAEFSGWGNWINTNTHRPQGNPTGQIL